MKNTLILQKPTLLACAVVLLSAVLGHAQQQPQVLHSHVRPVVASGQAVPVGVLPPSQRLNLAITLPLRNQAELTTLLDRLYDPTSPDYRHFLSVAQLTEEFGPTANDYQAVVDFAKANGFTVTATPPNRLFVDINGTVAQIENAFHVVMTVYQHPTENRTFYSPDREPSLNLTVPVTHIEGLNDFSIPRPIARQGAMGQGVRSNPGSGQGGAFLGSDIRAAYYNGGTLTGSGQAVGLLEFSGYSLSDVQAYFSNAGQSLTVPINNVTLDGATATGWTDSKSEAEVVLDIDQAISMAPGLAQVRVYIAPPNNVGVSDKDIFNKMLTENLAKQLSVSWNWFPDDPTTDDPIFLELAAHGQSVFVASGDDGAYTGTNSNDESYPGEDVYVTSVGGTDLTTNGAGGTWESETAWNQISEGGASGGGPSDDGFPIPSWQSSVINSFNAGSITKRNSPDVAAEAAFDNYVCYNNGVCQGNWGGTSFAAPRWAGFMALANQQAVAGGFSPLGFLNPTLYSIGQGLNYDSDFHDITSGNNSNGKGQSYNAVVGYDLATGWGSPNGQNLINDLSIGTLIPTITTLSSSATSVISGTTVTFTAAVKASYGGGAPTGQVEFYDVFNNIATLLSTQTLPASDVLTYSSNSFAVGTHSLTVIYNGSSVYFASISPVVVLSVTSAISYTISGTVTLNGSGLAGVNMTLSEGQSGSTTTNLSGTYTFGGLTGGINYLVVPSLAGYSFSPAGAGFDPLNSNQTANFAASITPPSGPVLAFTPGIISTAAGNGTAGYAGDGGTATNAELNDPWGVAVDGEGNFYIADTSNSRVRVANTQTTAIIVAGVSVQPGNIALLAGNGTAGYSGDGIPATQAELNQPTGVLVDGAGNLYIADSVNGRIREVSASGTISTIAGNGQAGSSGDGGPATSAEFYSPRGIALDTSGNLYIADFSANRVRAVNRQSSAITIAGVTIQPGNIATVAGNGTAGYLGDGGLATQAELNGPSKLAIDNLGNLYIADYYNNFIRKVSLSAGTITTAAGSGTPPYNNYFSGDGGPATQALMWLPGGVTVDAAGDFYVVDTNNNRIRIVSAATGIITTLAGSGPVANDSGFAGDGGPATSALLNFPMGAAVDSKGNIYIADGFNNRIRQVNVQQASLTFPQTNVGQGSTAQDVTVSNVGAQSLNISQISTSAAFNLNGADTTCSSGTTLAPGASCILGVEFAPVQVGSVTGSVTLTDNAVNSPQTILLSGTGALGTPTLSWTPATTSISYGTAIGAGVLDATATIYGNPVAGTFAYSETPSGGSSQTVSVGTILPVGIYTLSVLFTPNNTAAYTTATASIPFTVAQAPLSLQLNSSATSITAGQTVTFTTILSGVTEGTGPTGSVTFYDGSAPLGSGTISLVSGQYQATFSTNSLAVGTHNISAQYPGDGNYSSGTSNVVTVTVNSNTLPLTVSPTSLAFGIQGISSTSAAKKVTLTNNTGAVVTISSQTITGTNAPDFAQSSTTCGTTLALKASCTISVTFTPSASGARAATLTITDSAVNSPQVIALSGSGTPQVTLSSATFAFGNQADGTTSVAKTVTLTNNTSATLPISNVALTGANAAEFSVSANTCGTSVGGHSSCKISVVFAPVTAGAKTAALTITDTANNSPQSVGLTGTGLVPVSVTPPTLVYGTVKVGSTSAGKVVTIKNSLPTTLTLSNPTFTGTNPNDFAESATTCGTTLAAGASCTVSVVFKPTAKGTRVATLNIIDSANTSPQTVSLSGTGQ